MDTFLGTTIVSLAIIMAFAVSMQIFAYFAWHEPAHAKKKAAPSSADGWRTGNFAAR